MSKVQQIKDVADSWKSIASALLNKAWVGIYNKLLSPMKKVVSLIPVIISYMTYVFHGLLAFLILGAICLVVYETFRNTSDIIGPILMPQDLADMGYTPDVVAQRLIDSSESYDIDGGTEDEKDRPLSYKLSESDFVLPSMDISVKSASRYLRNLFGRNDRTFTGEILYYKSDNRISFRLRLDSKPILNTFAEFNEEGMKKLINRGGYELTKRISPYTLAMYHHIRDENKEAGDIVSFILKDFADTKAYVQAITLKGHMYEHDKQYDEAIREYERATELDQTYVTAYLYWGIALDEKEPPDRDGAIEKFMKALELDPYYIYAYYNWGLMLASKEPPDWDGAIEKYKKALEIEPDYAAPYEGWGRVLAKQGDCVNAERLYERASKIDGRSRQLDCTR